MHGSVHEAFDRVSLLWPTFAAVDEDSSSFMSDDQHERMYRLCLWLAIVHAFMEVCISLMYARIRHNKGCKQLNLSMASSYGLWVNIRFHGVATLDFCSI